MQLVFMLCIFDTSITRLIFLLIFCLFQHLQEELNSIDKKKQDLIASSQQMGKMKEKYALEPELVEIQENWDVLSSKIQVIYGIWVEKCNGDKIIFFY